MTTQPEKLCDCFGDSGLHASTFGVNGRRHCDLCGWPVQPNSVDVLTAVNSVDLRTDGVSEDAKK